MGILLCKNIEISRQHLHDNYYFTCFTHDQATRVFVLYDAAYSKIVSMVFVLTNCHGSLFSLKPEEKGEQIKFVTRLKAKSLSHLS